MFECSSSKHFLARDETMGRHGVRGELLRAMLSYGAPQKYWLCSVLGQSNHKQPCPTANYLMSNRRPRRGLADCLEHMPKGALLWSAGACVQGPPKGLLQCPSQNFYHCTSRFEICYHTQCSALSKPTFVRAFLT